MMQPAQQTQKKEIENEPPQAQNNHDPEKDKRVMRLIDTIMGQKAKRDKKNKKRDDGV